MKSALLVLTVLFVLVGLQSPTPVFAQSPPIQKVRVKIEGVHKESLIQKGRAFWMEIDKPTALERIESSLNSVLGVKQVTFKTKRNWILFGDYKEVVVTIEFVQGDLNSETIITAIERASDQNGIFRVKFLE
jgi:hypothetical protein